MKLNLKDEPKEWRKSTLLTALGLALITLLLHWRSVFADKMFFSVLVALLAVVLASLVQPHWFRGYHRFSMRLGFAISRFIGYTALILFFILILTPTGLVLRLLGKDILRLKPQPGATTYWHPRKGCSPLDRLF